MSEFSVTDVPKSKVAEHSQARDQMCWAAISGNALRILSEKPQIGTGLSRSWRINCQCSLSINRAAEGTQNILDWL